VQRRATWIWQLLKSKIRWSCGLAIHTVQFAVWSYSQSQSRNQTRILYPPFCVLESVLPTFYGVVWTIFKFISNRQTLLSFPLKQFSLSTRRNIMITLKDSTCWAIVARLISPCNSFFSSKIKSKCPIPTSSSEKAVV
jgi:hypothetical protein